MGTDMGVDLRSFAGTMAYQRLDVTQIGSCFQEMNGKTMPEGLQRRFAANARLEYVPDTIGDILPAKLPLQQPFLGPIRLIVLPPALQKQGSSVFLAFSIPCQEQV